MKNALIFLTELTRLVPTKPQEDGHALLLEEGVLCVFVSQGNQLAAILPLEDQDLVADPIELAQDIASVVGCGSNDCTRP